MKLPNDLVGVSFHSGQGVITITKKNAGSDTWTGIGADGTVHSSLFDEGLRTLIEGGEWPLVSLSEDSVETIEI